MLCNVTCVIHNMQYVLLWLRLLKFLLQQSIYSRIQQSILAASGIEAVRSCVTLFAPNLCTHWVAPISYWQSSCGPDINIEM